MIPILEPYKTSLHDFPSRDINPKDKGAMYALKNAEAIYSLYCQNQCSWGIGSASKFHTNRSYSMGRQNVDQYKNFLLNEYNDTTATETTSVESWDDLTNTSRGKRMGWMNISWQNLSPAPAIMNSLHGQFDLLDFDLYVDTIDADSRGLVEEEKYKKMVEAKFAEWQIEFKKRAGIPVDEDVVFPRSQEEFDAFESQDGFKLDVAVTMQKILRYTFDISRWDTVVRKKVIDDLICLGYGGVRDYYDAEEGVWKAKYLDPAYAICQYSNEFDFHDADWAGYLSYWTISNIRQKLPELKEEQIKAIAKQCHNLYGNPSGYWNDYNDLDPTTNVAKYDGYKVPVLEVEWMDNDISRNLHYRNRHGRDLIIDLGYDGEARPLSEESIKMGAKQDVSTIGLRTPYQCSWIVGTKHVFDYGKVRMPNRDGSFKPKLTYHFEQLLQPPIIENLKPILDEIAQLYLRYQNSIGMMIEKGYAINTSMIANVNLGGGTLPVSEVINMWHQTGRLLYSYGGNGLYSGGSALPVTPIDGGLGTRVDETIKSMEFAFRKIELFAGISLTSMGITPDPNVPTGSTKEALQATANALKPILNSCLELKQSVGESLMRRIQISIRNNERQRKIYSGVTNPTDIETLYLMEDMGVQYGLQLVPKPDTLSKARFEKWINDALTNSRENRPGIDLPDAIYFSSRLDAGADIRQLERQLRYAVEKNKQEKTQEQMANIEAQGQQNMQLAQTQSQMKKDEIVTEGQVKTQEEIVRGEIKHKQTLTEANLRFLDMLREAMEAEKGITTSRPSGGR